MVVAGGRAERHRIMILSAELSAGFIIGFQEDQPAREPWTHGVTILRTRAANTPRKRPKGTNLKPAYLISRRRNASANLSLDTFIGTVASHNVGT